MQPGTNDRTESMPPIDVGAVARALYIDGPIAVRMLQRHRHRIAPVARCAELVPAGSRVLDIGCGGGLLLACLASAGRIRSGLGIDSSRQAIEVARAAKARLQAGAAPVEFEHRAVEHGLPDGGFDAVCMVDVMHHIPAPAKRRAFHDALARVAEGGVFLYKDMCDAPAWRRGMNRLHDLVMARQWIDELPVELADAWAAEAGFVRETAEEHRMLWYGHELRVYRRPTGLPSASPRS